MALTLADCDRMAAAVEAAGVKFMMAYQMRHDPPTRRSGVGGERRGGTGQPGAPAPLHSGALQRGFVNGPTRWHLDPGKNVGMFMDDASHATDSALDPGRPTSVMAEIDNTITDVAPDDTGVAIYRYTNGAMAVLLNSSVTLAGENTTEVMATQA